MPRSTSRTRSTRAPTGSTPTATAARPRASRRCTAWRPALVQLARGRFAVYEQVVDRVASASRGGAWDGAGTHVLGLRLPAGTEPVGQLERRSDVLRAAADAAERHVHAVLSS